MGLCCNRSKSQIGFCGFSEIPLKFRNLKFQEKPLKLTALIANNVSLINPKK
jgi:hypothetical protein